MTTAFLRSPLSRQSLNSPWRDEQGRYHRLDGPALVDPENGIQWWFRNGVLHRDGGPAVLSEDGSLEWYRNGVLHRLDGPAVIDPNAAQEWWVDGQRHRVDGPAVVYEDGETNWWVNGKRHRVDGPAVVEEYGRKEWWVNGQKHRLDGPAVIDLINGFTHEEWWVKDEQLGHQDLNLLYLLKDLVRLTDSMAFSLLSGVTPHGRPVLARMVARHTSVDLTERARAYASLLATSD